MWQVVKMENVPPEGPWVGVGRGGEAYDVTPGCEVDVVLVVVGGGGV